MMITNEGVVIRISVEDISVIGRNTSGVKLMNIDQDSDIRVASIAKVRDDGEKSEYRASVRSSAEASVRITLRSLPHAWTSSA